MTRPSPLGVRGCCLVLLALAWTHAGIWKAVDLDGFRQIIRAHDLLPDAAPVTIGVITIEVALGLALACVAAAPRAVHAARLLTIISLVLLAGLGVYLILVPAEPLRRVACGCFGVVSTPGRWGLAPTALLHAVLGLAHAPILLARAPARAPAPTPTIPA